MDISILLLLSLQTTLFLMSINTLKGRINSLDGQIRANRVHIEGQAQRINANLEEVAQFNEKALGTLSQNMAMCGYEVKEVKDKLEIGTKEIKADIKQSTHTIAVTPLKVRI